MEIKFLILATVQGVTEFLPISSSGHLVLLESLWKIQSQEYFFFNLLIHLATLIATLTFYRNDLWALIDHGIQELKQILSRYLKNNASSASSFPVLKFGSRILLTTLLTGIIGITVRPLVKDFQNLQLLAIFFFVTGVILSTSRLKKIKREADSSEDPLILNLSIVSALIIGLAQGLAVIPGISRSGITITVGILFGLGNREAMKYSILISIPVILAAFGLEFYENFWETPKSITSTGATIYALSFLISFFVGYFSLHLLLKIVKKHRIYLFTYYLVPLSIILFLSIGNFTIRV